MEKVTTDSSFIAFWKHIEKNRFESWTIVSSAIFAISAMFDVNKQLFWFITLKHIIIIALFSNVVITLLFHLRQTEEKEDSESKCKELTEMNQKQAEEIQKLENKIQDIYRIYSNVFTEHLASLFFKLNLTDNERISMYKFQDDYFYIIGRYSINPDLKEINRDKYPKEGLIYKAWCDGEYFLNDGPEFNKKNKVYNFFNSIAPIDKVTFDSLTMKSRSYYLKAFTNTKKIDRIAIIVIESKKNKTLAKNEIDIVLKEEENKLSSFVESINWNFPNINNAQNTGF